MDVVLIKCVLLKAIDIKSCLSGPIPNFCYNNYKQVGSLRSPPCCIRVSYGYSREQANVIVVSFNIHKYISVSRAMKV